MRVIVLAAVMLLASCSQTQGPCGAGCASGETCLDGACQMVCNIHGDCPGTQMCIQGTCKEGGSDGGIPTSSSSRGRSSSRAGSSSTSMDMCSNPPDAVVTCTVDGGQCAPGMFCSAGLCVSECQLPAECNGTAAQCGDGCAADRTACVDLGANADCARMPAPCARLVGLANRLRLPDGGARSIPDELVCNPGAANVVAGGVTYVAGTQCETFPALANPPPVMCVSAQAGGLPAYIGYCRATCREPSTLSAAENMYSCPAGWTCDTSATRVFTSYRPDGGTQTCTTASQCPAQASCESLNGAATKVCAFPYGFCQPQDGGP